jgi:hypothetical protein
MDVEENYCSVSLCITCIKHNLHILIKTAVEGIGHEQWIDFEWLRIRTSGCRL